MNKKEIYNEYLEKRKQLIREATTDDLRARIKKMKELTLLRKEYYQKLCEANE